MKVNFDEDLPKTTRLSDNTSRIMVSNAYLLGTQLEDRRDEEVIIPSPCRHIITLVNVSHANKDKTQGLTLASVNLQSEYAM